MSASSPPDLEAEIDKLYASPLAGFVEARKALAARARAAGDREAARRVAALPRPSATAWAVNRVCLLQAPLHEAVRSSGDRLRRAHEGDPVALPLAAALAARREAVAAAVRAGLGQLADAGHGAGLAAERRIRGTFEALAAGAASTPPGRLVADLEPPSFDAIAGLEPALVARSDVAAPAEPRTRPNDTARALAEAERARLRRRLEKALEAERAASVRADAAAAEIAEAERRLDRARFRRQEVAAEVERARVEITAARGALAEAGGDPDAVGGPGGDT